MDGTSPHFITFAFVPAFISDDYGHLLWWRDVVARLKEEIAVEVPHSFDVAVWGSETGHT